MKTLFSSRTPTPILTYTLIGICVLMTILSDFIVGQEIFMNFIISKHSYRPGVFLPEVMHGEFWRLITPIFFHASVIKGFGALHIIFNMVWLRELGRAIELISQPWKLGLLVAVIGVLSNLSQYIYAGPYFVGMSGVVYGLLGYLWAYGKFHPRARLKLNQEIMVFMLIWLVVCWVGMSDIVANMAHTSGLLVGLLWGWLESVLAKKPGML